MRQNYSNQMSAVAQVTGHGKGAQGDAVRGGAFLQEGKELGPPPKAMGVDLAHQSHPASVRVQSP